MSAKLSHLFFSTAIAFKKVCDRVNLKIIYQKAKNLHFYVNCSEHKTNIEEYELALDSFETAPLFLQNPENVKLYKLAKSNLNKLKAVALYSPAVPR